MAGDSQPANIWEGVLSYFTRHRTAASLLLVAIVAVGLGTVPGMRTQFFPDVVVDNVTVTVKWQGASAEEIDSEIVEALEPALMGVEGVAESESSSREGLARIQIEFEPGWDIARGANDLRAAAESVTTLPEDIDDPVIRRGAWRDRVTDVVISGPLEAGQLSLYAQELISRLFDAGVTRASLFGVAAPETVVEVRSVNLLSHEITLAEIAATLQAEVSSDPSGEFADARTRVRTGSQKRSADQISEIILRTNEDGTKLVVSDIAEVRVEDPRDARRYYVDGEPAIMLRVDRSDRGDAIGIQRAVEAIAADLERTLPEGVEVRLVRTRSEQITSRINILLQNGAIGLGLVIVLLFMFLRVRTAFWVTVGIPVALLAAVTVMWLAGLTFNMLSLFALIITLGIVVDDGIVVGEHADSRVRWLGENKLVAAERAAHRMALPILAASLSTIIAFYALTFVGGRFGDLVVDIPITVIAVLAASMVECFLILPNHLAHSKVSAADDTQWYDWPSRIVNWGFVWVRRTIFLPLVRAVIVLRYPTLALGVLLLAVQSSALLRGDVPWRFFDAPEQGSITGKFVMTSEANRSDTMEMMRGLQETARSLGEEYESRHGNNPVSFVMGEVGGYPSFRSGGGDTTNPDRLGGMTIELIDPDLRPYSSFAFVRELERRIERHPLLESITFRNWRLGPGGSGVNVEFFGSQFSQLKAAAEAFSQELLQFEEVSAVEDSLDYDKRELILDLTPQGLALGFDLNRLGRTLHNRLSGIEVATFPSGAQSTTIRVQIPEEELASDFLDRTMLASSSGVHVPLADLVEVTEHEGFSSVLRKNGVRQVNVTADLSGDDPARAAAVADSISEEVLPRISRDHGVLWRLAGLASQEQKFIDDALFGLIVALGGIYAVLVWIFSNWWRPVVIMSVIPFGMVGAIIGHAHWDVPFTMFSVIGFLGLTGIILNDSIVLAARIGDYEKDRDPISAIVDGVSDRLRPVFLTTATTVLGLTPLLFERSQQAQFLKPTVITLVYGLGFGVFLILLLIPALMAIQHDFSRRVSALGRVLAFRVPFIRICASVIFLVAMAWLAATVGATLFLGDIPAALAWLPLTDTLSPLVAAYAVFAVGMLAGFAVLYVLIDGIRRTRSLTRR